MSALAESLRSFGADEETLHAFDSDAPGLLPYASMLTVRAQPNSDLACVDGVFEWQNEPLVFLVASERLQGDVARLNRLRRLIAMRGDAPYLGVFSSGSLQIYNVSLDARTASDALVELDKAKVEKAATFAYLGNKRPGVAPGQRQWISQVILNLLASSLDRLKAVSDLHEEEAISLVGRALFARFLADRHLIPKTVASDSQELATLFDNASRARATSDWLDQTFNGDFLPLARSVFRRIPTHGYSALGDILRKAPDGQLSLGWQESWNNLDFAHIPVGVLSQAYEHYLRRHSPDQQRKEGGFYTPRLIADLMVRGAFAALSRDRDVHDVKVLDPAVGAGVFLLTVFRELVAARWRRDGVRPDTKVLRQILYQQIVGLDINESALRFAALGLYLISIELDPHPTPVRKLRFRDLRGSVLQKIATDDNDKLGSLGSNVDPAHVGKYDLVIGNPPWSSGTRLASWRTVETIVHEVASKRIPNLSAPPPLPNEGLDLPFVWRAMEWCKSGGQLAFALHARLLFQQGDGMREARRLLFSALDVSAVVNGAELRQTKVWPEISAPFCLLYARNSLPSPASAFRFVTPRLERALNDAGAMRIDATNAGFVTSRQVTEVPFILKILARGSDADLEVYQRLRDREMMPLGQYWAHHFGVTRGKPNSSGNGYQLLRPSSRIRKNGDGLPGADARYLANLPELTPDAASNLIVSRSSLRPFNQQRIHDPRSPDIFSGPLLIVHQSPPAGQGRIHVTVSDHAVAYSETYYGYSAARHKAGRQLVRYLALVLSSQVALWLALILSGKFGFEREVVEKSTIDEIPLPTFDALDKSEIEKSNELFQLVAKSPTDESWQAVDQWVAKLYGLSDRDLQTILDTLTYSLPFSENRKRAEREVSSEQVGQFARTLGAELQPWAQRFSRKIQVTSVAGVKSSPWKFLKVSSHTGGVLESGRSPDWAKFIGLADELAATELVFPNEAPGILWLARLGQERYWSKTAARQVAQRLIWGQMGWLRGKAA